MQYLYGAAAHLAGVDLPEEGTIETDDGTRDRWGAFNRFVYAQRVFFRSGNDPERLAFATRLVGVVLAVGLAALVAVLTWRLAGPPAALLAATLTAFLPDVLAHAGITYNDVPLALAYLAGLWAWDRAIRRPTLARAAVAAVLSGLALGVKFSALALGAAALVLFVLEAMARGRDRAWWTRIGTLLPPAVLITYVTLVLVYRGDVALTDFRWGIAQNIWHASFGHGVPVTLLGRTSPDGFWYFFPLAIVLKTPAALHALGLLAVIGFWRSWTGRATAPGMDDAPEAAAPGLDGSREATVPGLDGHRGAASPGMDRDPGATAPGMDTDWGTGRLGERGSGEAGPPDQADRGAEAGPREPAPAGPDDTPDPARDTAPREPAHAGPGDAPDPARDTAPRELGSPRDPAAVGGRRSAVLTTRLRLVVVGALVFLAFLLQANLNIGIRHALPLLPLLAILVAVGATRLWRAGPRLARWAVGVLIVAFVASSLAYYPHFLTYFTEYVPFRKELGHRVMVDSNLDWGQGLLELRDWMDERGVERIYLSYFGSALPSGYGIDYVPLQSFFPLRPPDAPDDAPDPEWLVVSATNLAGMYLPRDPFTRLRLTPPYDVLANSMYVYRLGPAAEQNAGPTEEERP